MRLFSYKFGRSKADRCLPRILLMVLTAACLNLTPVSSSEDGIEDNYKVCHTKDCVDMGSQLSSQLGNKNLICKDFYKFVCGNWHIQHPFPPGKHWWDQFLKVEEKKDVYLKNILEEDNPEDNPTLMASKQYHRACMDLDAINKDDINSIKRILAKQGEWPMLWGKKKWNGNHTTWKNLEMAYAQLTGESSFFGISLVVKQKAFVLSVNQPKFLLSASTLASNNLSAIFEKNTYRSLIQNIVLEFAGPDISPAYRFAIATEVSEMLDFEIDLAKVIQKSGTTPKQKLLSLDEFQRYYDDKLKFSAFWEAKGLPPPEPKARKCIHRIIWVDEFRRLLGITDPDILNEFTPITVSTGHYFHNLCQLLEKTPDKVIANFIHWRLVRSLVPYTRGKVKDIWNNYQKLHTPNKKTQQRDRYLKCIEENEIKDILYHQLLKKYFPDEINEGVFDVINAVNSETWRGFQGAFNTKYLQRMQQFIKYKSPLYLTNLKYITQTSLEELPLVYIDQVLGHKRYKARRNQLKLMKKAETHFENAWIKRLWNAKIISEIAWGNNSIEIPAMSLQPPFYSKDLPLSFVYGAFGVQLARHTSEILNRYSGSIYGSTNKKVHDNIVNCYRFQIWGEYPEFTYEDLRTEFGTLPNSFQTKDSKHIWSNKIQDATGLDVAFKSYKRRMRTRGEENMRLPGLEEYTDEQLFFIAYANAFCEVPGTVLSSKQATWQNERTYGNADMVDMSIINNEDFGFVFNCSIHTPMNPPKKCKFWLDHP